MQENNSPENLIKKYLKGTCTEQEKALVESWHLHDLSQSTAKPSKHTIQSAYNRGRRALDAHLQAERPVRKLWPRIAAAASLLIVLSIGTLLFLKNPADKIASQTDIAPGGNHAILTLSNGQKINLTDAKDGALAQQGKVTVSKTADGNVSYLSQNKDIGTSAAIDYNTMSTPAGGQYHLVLEDGTGVWLNAASSIKFPTAFTGAERKVEITGEVYFEVAHNAAKPFKVLSNKQAIKVLGTHFNVNAYPDEENVKTTLLEGSVRVSNSHNSIIIKPGQQSIARAGDLRINQTVDLDEVMAWKNGYFRFTDENIESVMRKLSRWYNIEVQYQASIPNDGFNGVISRSKNISQVLKMLEKTKAVHFKIEGRRVTVIQ